MTQRGCGIHPEMVIGCAACMSQTPTGRTRPLTEGYVRKGGHNAFPSQITQRPPPPGPSRRPQCPICNDKGTIWKGGQGGDYERCECQPKPDYAHIEMRVVFMAGWDACFAKRDAEGNVPADADDRADAQAAFEAFMKTVGG
jgi:hypothetical protein